MMMTAMTNRMSIEEPVQESLLHLRSRWMAPKLTPKRWDCAVDSDRSGNRPLQLCALFSQLCSVFAIVGQQVSSAISSTTTCHRRRTRLSLLLSPHDTITDSLGDVTDDHRALPQLCPQKGLLTSTTIIAGVRHCRSSGWSQQRQHHLRHHQHQKVMNQSTVKTTNIQCFQVHYSNGD